MRALRKLCGVLGATLVAAFSVGPLEAAACGPFADLSVDDPFCPSILQLYYLGITSGTSPSTFGPTQPVTRQVLAAILARGSRAATRTSGRRAALRQFWPTTATEALRATAVGTNAEACVSDGEDVWATSLGQVQRIHARDGKVIGTWTAGSMTSGLVAMGRVFFVEFSNPGRLWALDPSLAPAALTLVSSALGGGTFDLAFDGARIWTSNSNGNTLSIVPPSGAPIATVGGFSQPAGIIYDGSNIWVANAGNGTLSRLDSAGSVLDSVAVGSAPQRILFDGTNIWVPNYLSDSVTVVNAASRAVVATLQGNGLDGPLAAAFDGERVLVSNNEGNSVSLWRAADLTELGTVSTGADTGPAYACSDGIDFWVPLYATGQILRF